MFILQLIDLRTEDPTVQNPTVMAVARSENIELLAQFFHHCLNVGSDGSTIYHYEDTLPNGTPCIKMFKKGSALEYFWAPKDQNTMIVNIGTYDERLRDLIAELTRQTEEHWNNIVHNVVDIQTETDALNTRTVEIEKPLQITAQ
jgi:hypothetical protein